MNPKDKNLVKGLSALCVLFVVFLYVGLKICGNAISLCGVVTIFYWAGRLGLFAKEQFVKKPIVLKTLGSWAIVTECTGGLGKCFAQELAKRGQNLVLIARNPKKLEDVAKELKENYSVQTQIVVFDFGKASLGDENTFYRETLPRVLAAEPIGGDVGLLVNNVGVGDEAPFAIDEVLIQDVAEMVKVNCGAVVNMTGSLLPLMKHRSRGAIINVSSGSCAQPSPYLATYASTKAFMKHFSMSTNRENQQHGVVALCITPYYISGTGLYPNAKPSLNAPAAIRIVEGALASLGKSEVSFSYNVHAVMGFIFGTIWEDPIFAPLLSKIGRKLKLNGNMLKLQTVARGRSKAKNKELWEPVEARSNAMLAEYKLESSSNETRRKQE